MYESLKYYTNWNKPDAKRQILYDSICMSYLGQIGRQKVEAWLPGTGVNGGSFSLGRQKVLEMVGGDGYTTKYTYLMPLNYTLKNG